MSDNFIKLTDKQLNFLVSEEVLYEDDSEEAQVIYTVVHNEGIHYSDLEKGYTENSVIIRDEFTHKFYRLKFNNCRDGRHFNTSIKEVTEKTKTITYYE